MACEHADTAIIVRFAQAELIGRRAWMWLGGARTGLATAVDADVGLALATYYSRVLYVLVLAKDDVCTLSRIRCSGLMAT